MIYRGVDGASSGGRRARRMRVGALCVAPGTARAQGSAPQAPWSRATPAEFMPRRAGRPRAAPGQQAAGGQNAPSVGTALGRGRAAQGPRRAGAPRVPGRAWAQRATPDKAGTARARTRLGKVDRAGPRQGGEDARGAAARHGRPRRAPRGATAAPRPR
jgi:hypothetical protein